MKVLRGLKDVLRDKIPAIQGSRLYYALMQHLHEWNKPRWMRKQDQQRKVNKAQNRNGEREEERGTIGG